MSVLSAQKAPAGISHRMILALGLFPLLFFVFVLSLSLGSVHIPFVDILAILAGKETATPAWASCIPSAFPGPSPQYWRARRFP